MNSREILKGVLDRIVGVRLFSHDYTYLSLEIHRTKLSLALCLSYS